MRVGSVMQRMRAVAGTLAAGPRWGEGEEGAGRGSRPFSSPALPEPHAVY